jgi:D-aspartate ligase
MFVLNSYSSKTGKVTYISLANSLLEEHTPTARGNYANIVNLTKQEIQNDIQLQNIISKVIKFLEEIQYVGFANFDIKYNSKNNTYNFFEINIRQGNSHYHATAGGYNLMQLLVGDLIPPLLTSPYQEEEQSKIIMPNNKKLFTIVPSIIPLIYVRDWEKKKEILRLILTRQVVNPLFYKKDFSIKRFYYLFINQLGHFIKFYKYFK